MTWRGWIRTDDFCGASGLTPDHVATLVRDGRLAYVRDETGAAVGFYDDSPPSEDELRALGYPVDPDYTPEGLWSGDVEGDGPVAVPPGESRGGRPALLESRGAVHVEQFAAAAGVDPAAVRALVESGALPGLFDSEGRATLVFDDEVPAPDALRALGVEPTRDYRPEDVASYPWAPDTWPDEGDGTWTMSSDDS